MSDTPLRLSGEAYKTDPYPLYDDLRAACPVHQVEFPSGVHAWLVTGYDAALATLTDRRLGKNHSRGNDRWRARASIMPEPQHSQLQVHLLHQDAPRHTIMRKLVLDWFAPARVERMRRRFESLADDLVDALPSRGPVDIIDGFAAHFPFRVLAEVIGLPRPLAGQFRREWGKVVQPVGPHDPGRPRYEALLHGLQTYIAEVTASKRGEPGDDLLSTLVEAHDTGVLTREELDSMVFQLLVAGQEPVTNQISTALMALLRRPERLTELRDDPGLLQSAVEELLRFDSAFELTTWRFFAEDSELHGTEVPAGDSVIVSLCAANRDPRRFDNPDELDFTRSPNPHLAFGHGPHFCPGAALARVELQTALGTLLRRLPGLRFAIDPEDITWIRAVLGRGVNTLPVTYDRRI
ncbi:cytochrome P450 [Lentzea sp. HUAS12]|uniref:cytochrome P450 family protein n=1 Tax=Lentzea sp. HUAS12 TaxID=2951806 RepID=UPI0020A05436|nr:cytochrome P450 [Lentzea sp. HUAS12]USX54019.1 cytochrome P450 [Lentzea sp. HUAS12]